ncbi:unnamed protein product [Rotaria sordida]|uniref:Uncharacterized protein n=1 Tax=Rotaria sordida TaxID=392033 RepID=A0A815J9K0_9BILA|nr:unnamed protein product [Rotaria sordida]CAF3994731.1 unnamed protein product [Rotaria sordida]
MIVVHIEHKVIGLPASDFYYFLDALHTQKKKIQTSSIKLQTEHQKINTIYQYFIDLSSSSSSSSSKKSSSSSVSTTNKKQTNSSVTTNEEGTINGPSPRDSIRPVDPTGNRLDPKRIASESDAFR